MNLLTGFLVGLVILALCTVASRLTKVSYWIYAVIALAVLWAVFLAQVNR